MNQNEGRLRYPSHLPTVEMEEALTEKGRNYKHEQKIRTRLERDRGVMVSEPDESKKEASGMESQQKRCQSRSRTRSKGREGE
jgi:hypothetical protein